MEQTTHIMKRTSILRNSIQLLPQRAIRPSVNRVRMRRAHDVGSRLVHRVVDYVPGDIQEPVLAAVDDLALLVDEDQVGCFDQAERGAEGVHPEGVRVYGVAECDVAGDAFIQAVFAEDAEGGCSHSVSQSASPSELSFESRKEY